MLSVMLLFIVVIVIIASCQKSYNNDNRWSETTPGLNQLFSDFRTAPQNFSISAGHDTIVYGEKGTGMHFYENSFKDAAGNIITNGTVSIQLTEMYKPGDMISNQATTTSADGQILQSGGEINITAKMNGKEVFANSYGLKFKQDAPSVEPMSLF